MTKKHHILFLASWYPSKVSPQSGNFVQKHAAAVSSYCNVYVLHIAPSLQDEKFVLEERNLDNLFEVIVYYKKITTKIPGVSHLQKLIRRKKAHWLGYQSILKKAKKIDLVHVNVMFPAGLFALHLKKRYHIPFIITEHWSTFLADDPHQLSFIETFYVKRIAKSASLILPISESLKNALIKFGIKNELKVISNAVDTSIFKPDLNRNRGKVQFVHLSDLKDNPKNVTGIINAVKKLSELRTDFSITIAGNGDIERCRNYSNSLGIDSALIHFEGSKTTQEVAQLMQQHDVFVLFSNYETFSVVIAEAWLCGIPVISSNCGGLADEITPENGIKVPVKDELALMNAMSYLIDHISNYDKKTITGNALNKYSYESVGKLIFDHYKKILD